MSEREQIDQQVARAWLNHRSPLDVPEFERAMRRCLDALDAANARADEAYLEPRYCKGCSIKLHTETRRADEAEREVTRLKSALDECWRNRR